MCLLHADEFSNLKSQCEIEKGLPCHRIFSIPLKINDTLYSNLHKFISTLCRLHRFGLFLADNLGKKFGQQFFLAGQGM